MTDALAQWMAAYQSAWETNEPDQIRALVTDDVVYRNEPWTEPWRGPDAVVQGWLARKDEPGNHSFDWSPVAVTDDLWIVQGTTAYTDGRTYSNLWVIRPGDGGRAREFTEWWMDQATPS